MKEPGTRAVLRRFHVIAGATCALMVAGCSGERGTGAWEDDPGWRGEASASYWAAESGASSAAEGAEPWTFARPTSEHDQASVAEYDESLHDQYAELRDSDFAYHSESFEYDDSDEYDNSDEYDDFESFGYDDSESPAYADSESSGYDDPAYEDPEPSEHADGSIAEYADPAVIANAAPTVSGTPTTVVVQGTSYSFAPQAVDLDGDVLTYRVSNPPPWATFDATTGRLTGTPSAGDIGVYPNVQISATDGQAEAVLPAFDIRVEAVGYGVATLSWSATPHRPDGSPITVAGFNVYWGREPGDYPNKVTVGPGTTTYVVENLAPGLWYFVTSVIDADQIESQLSEVVTKTIQ